MPDISIEFDGRQLRGDFVLGAFDLATGDELRSSIIMSLFTDPGWWADTFEPDAIGCRLLELRTAKRTAETLLRARDYCRAALRWLIEDGVASQVDVLTAWQGATLAIAVTVTKPGIGQPTRYDFVWAGV